jgi:nucleoside-diphosphate-sugar epimerase
VSTRFVKAAVRDEPIAIYGTGDQIRDFTFIDDMVQANYPAAAEYSGRGQVFNVSGCPSISFNESLSLCSSIAGKRLSVNWTSVVAGDVTRTGASSEAFGRAVGLRPQIDIEDGLAAQLEWGVEVFSSAASKNAVAEKLS